MKVFLTGGTGYIGSVVAEKLLHAGHHVVGLARSETSVQNLEARGVEPLHGDVSDTRTLTEAALSADGVIHTAFDISTGDFSASNALEATAVGALLSGLESSGKPFVLTSGTGVLGDTGGRVYDENTPIAPSEFPAVQALQTRLSIENTVLNATGCAESCSGPPMSTGGVTVARCSG